MKTKIIRLKKYSLKVSLTYVEVTPLFIKWMASQAYNNNDI